MRWDHFKHRLCMSGGALTLASVWAEIFYLHIPFENEYPFGMGEKVGSASGAHTAAPGEVLIAKGLMIAKNQCFVEAFFLPTRG